MSMLSRLIGSSRKQADDRQMSALAAENASLSERLMESERWNSVQTKQLEILRSTMEQLDHKSAQKVQQLKQEIALGASNLSKQVAANTILSENFSAATAEIARIAAVLKRKEHLIELLEAELEEVCEAEPECEYEDIIEDLTTKLAAATRLKVPSNAPMDDSSLPFDEQVLRLCWTGNIEDSKVTPGKLQRAMPPNTSPATYFKQYLSYIKEDVRSQIADEINEIFAKSSKVPRVSVPARVELHDPRRLDEEDSTRMLSMHTLRSKFPKLDHGFNMEVICIRLPSSNNKTKYVLGVASEVRNDDEDDRSDDAAVMGMKMVEISVKLLAHQYGAVAALTNVEWHWLCGLIPAERMHAACSARQAPPFFRHVLECNPKLWPAATGLTAMVEIRTNYLNPQQQNVVRSLYNSPASGLYCLVGPPGTGKTSTIVHLLRERAVNFPEERILLTAPSNKAVQVVMLQLLLRKTASLAQLEPAVAFAGVPTTLPEEMEEHCAKKYASFLVAPLRAVSQHNGNLPKMVEALDAARAEILARLDRLVTRRGLPVDRTVLSPVIRLIGDVDGLFQSTAFEKPKDVLDFVATVRGLILNSAFTLEKYVLQKAQIVFSTLVSSGRKSLAKLIRNFDCVVVDEAAQALVPETFIPFKFNPRMYVLIGDPQQLPGMANSHQLRDLGYDASLMKIFTDARSPHVETLTTQYRMHPSICKWTSHQFYDGRLVTGGEPTAHAQPAAVLRILAPPMALRNLPSAFVDCNFQEQKSAHGAISNMREAEVVMAVAKYLLRQGVRPDQIGVITFYAAQVQILKEMRAKLAKELPQLKDIVSRLAISTVDGFQGDERDITLVSCVRTIPSVGFLNDHRRINVALSRAKHARWVFGSAKALSGSNSVFADLFRWIGKPGENNTAPPTAIVGASDVCASIGYKLTDKAAAGAKKGQNPGRA